MDPFPNEGHAAQAVPNNNDSQHAAQAAHHSQQAEQAAGEWLDGEKELR